MFHGFYGDGTVIRWPSITVGTEESFAAVVAEYGGAVDWTDDLPGALRWSGADLPYTVYPGQTEQGLADGVQTAASTAIGEQATAGWCPQWEQSYNQFLRRFPAAARAAGSLLVAGGTVDEGFLAIAADEDGVLLALSMTPERRRVHFPNLAGNAGP